MFIPSNRQAQQPRFFFPPISVGSSSPATLNLATGSALSRQTSRSSHHGHGQSEGSGHRRRVSYGREQLHSRLGSGILFGAARNSTDSLDSDGREFQIQEALKTSITLDKDPQQVIAIQPRLQETPRVTSPNPTEMDIIDALTDIHHILYFGEEFLDKEGSDKGWEQKIEGLRNVLEQYFESDCVYDTPLVRLTSRSSLLSHFALLHLLSTLSLPSLTPSAVIRHARSLTSALMLRLVGVTPKDVDPAFRPHKDAIGERSGWWRLWEVRAECSEIGEMESYDGYHLAMIDHIISLHLLPSVTRPLSSESTTPSSLSLSSPLSTPSPSSAHLPGVLSSLPAPSFARRLVGTLANELDLVLKWELPLTTVVEINEVGKATYIRDIVDLRDAVETFLPFAKRFAWLTRSLAGIMSSVLGDIVIRSTLPNREERIEATIDTETVQTGQRTGEYIGKSSSRERSKPRKSGQVGERENSLGLENLGSESRMAPDVDDEALAGD
ncbi:Hypothetical Protein CGB_M0370C [Cryptococcus gattii WM276]|uniref:Uncharacterized protein n=1 Tax=Cryptococcus gattii serotype B (strain WM276 / ATCC MYA-4071) TaxID=367775 RepID=E6RF12_CRYGW|nr:Hypothetical Protein CGB_M0370C [Cryptococcus gattii WM276]ADV25427.1 Hypothetical Protein CGB_M0370C [Cryptococcus gattii WM276]KJD99880.1 hypothetical protein I311_06526 [Cryptococcus gattii NT-10]